MSAAVAVLLGGGATAPGHRTRPETADARHVRVWQWHRPLLIASLLLSVVVPLAATADWQFPGRVLLTVAFATLVPGIPVALALRLPDVLLTLALGIATSFSWALLQGVLVLELGSWHPVRDSWAALPVTVLAALLARYRIGPALARLRAVQLPPRTGAGRPIRRERLVGTALLLLAAGLWWWGTRVLDPGRAGDLGVLPLFGWQLWAALVLLAVVAVLALTAPRVDQLVLLGCTVLVALVAYTSVAVADGYSSVPVSWVHVGFVEYVSVHGSVPRGVDARFSWPAFWGAGAQVVALAGLPDARGLLVLAPVFNTLVDLPALLVIGRVVTRSRRWAWVGVGIYLVANWYQQDYFSPQATALTIHLAVLATLLRLAGTGGAVRGGAFRSLPRRVLAAAGRVPARPGGVGAGTERAVGLLLVVLVAAVVAGHQLTPVLLVLTLVVFTLTGRTRFRALWLVAAVALAGWFSFGATDFWLGHVRDVLGDVGQVQSSVGAGVSERLTGNATYQRAQYVRIASSVLLLALAGVGAWTLRTRAGAWLFAALALVPFGLVAVQSYGGEVVIRCFVFAAPVLAPLAAVAIRSAVALRPTGAGRAQVREHRAVVLLSIPVVVLALGVLVFTRGLNTSFERTPADLVAASTTFYDVAAPGDAVGVPQGTPGLTVFGDVLDHGQVPLDVDECTTDGIDACTAGSPPRFVLLSSTQEATGELLQGRPAGWLRAFGDTLVASGEYRVVDQGRDARLLERTS